MQNLQVKSLKKSFFLVSVLLLATPLVACSPKVGSPEWCAAIKEKAAGDITTNEAKDFAKHCVFK